MAAAGSSRDLYDALVAVHVACAIVGFGSLAITGVYGFTSRNPSGPESIDESRRYFRSPGRLELLVLVVPVFGVAALIFQPGGRGAAQLWALLAVVVWLVAGCALLGIVRPAEARLRAGLAQPDPDVVTLTRAGARLGWATVVTDLSFFVALLLMIFQPR